MFYPTSLKPFVDSNMFRFTLFIFLWEWLRPRALLKDLAERADLADFESDLRERTDLAMRTDLLFDLDRWEPSLLVLLLALFDRFLPFLEVFDFRLELLLLRLLRADMLRPLLTELLLRLLRSFLAEFWFDYGRWRLADVGILLLPERCLRVSCNSAIISFIRKFFYLLSVISISSAALFSRFWENSRTRLLNWETPPALRTWRFPFSSPVDEFCNFAYN